ncbi:MAG: hypothetical protein AABY15_00900 [Nanoarchaeota archaeon]
MAQRSRDFYIWISWRPEDRENPLIHDFCKELSRVRGLSFIHTFAGLCFWDDKYADNEAGVRLKTHLSQTLPDLAPLVETSDYVLMTIQPSDDMYVPRSVEKIQNAAKVLLKQPWKKYVIGYKQGYIMNYGTKEIAEYSTVGWKTDEISTYHTNTVPPFFTIIFPKEEFLNVEKHYKYTGPYKSHEDITDYFEFYDLGGRGFVVGTHGANISTVFHHRYKGKMIEKGEKDLLFMQMGIYFSDPYYIQEGVRLYTRKLFNKIPFQETLKKWYHKLPYQMQRL